MIRPMGPADLDPVSGLWLDTNLQAHSFVPPAYWRDHLEEVRVQLAQAEVYVCEDPDQPGILGFLGLQGDYLAGLFVRREAQGGGIGRRLLDQAKEGRGRLVLHVYKHNPRAAAFYRREGFTVREEQVDPSTGEAELCMVWQAGPYSQTAQSP